MAFSSEQTSDEYLHLNHCGVQHLNDSYHCKIRESGRVDYHMLYIAQGVCYTEVLGEKKTVTAGGVILFKPHERQKYEFFEKDDSISCYIHFTGTGCEEILNEIGFSSERVIDVGKSQTIVSIFEKMEIEADMKRPFYDKYCMAYLMELFTVIGRRNAYGGNEIYIKNKSMINAVCQLMYDEYSQPVSLERYAQFCHLSVSRFSHIFKSAIGITPLEYITKIRIDKACEMLVGYNYSISEIAEKSGFSSQNYFARIFKKYMGVSPKKYAVQELSQTAD